VFVLSSEDEGTTTTGIARADDEAFPPVDLLILFLSLSLPSSRSPSANTSEPPSSPVRLSTDDTDLVPTNLRDALAAEVLDEFEGGSTWRVGMEDVVLERRRFALTGVSFGTTGVVLIPRSTSTMDPDTERVSSLATTDSDSPIGGTFSFPFHTPASKIGGPPHVGEEEEEEDEEEEAPHEEMAETGIRDGRVRVA
jgi:hypothetical protein